MVDRDPKLTPNIQPGVGVDAAGGGVVDPTKNVDALVLASVKRLDDLGAEWVKRQDDLREALDRRTTELNTQRDSYTLRIDMIRDSYDQRMENTRTSHTAQLEGVKSDFGKQIAAILASQQEKSAQLLSAQVAETTTRLAVVEKNQNVLGGQSAVRDPQMAETLASIQATLKVVSQGGDLGTGSKQGQAQMGSIMNAGLIALIGIGSIVTPILIHFASK